MQESQPGMTTERAPEKQPSQGGTSAPVPGPARARAHGKRFLRGQQLLQLKGVTYGPFAPSDSGEPFPPPARTAVDFTHITAAGFNAIRVYHPPPDWLLDLADERGLSIHIDVPWSQHLCFLDSRRARSGAQRVVRDAAARGRRHSSALAYSIGNEIPPAIIRWHGRRRVERFLKELADTARQADPAALVTYGNFPPTEYLQLDFLDFATFNVYLHRDEPFRRYLLRLQHLTGERPLVLGELGMDTLRNGEAAQADFLRRHLREIALQGLAGAFIFAWTDDWFTGGHAVEDWAFGITLADRSPKAALPAVRDVNVSSPCELLADTPRVSVVVCSYNGAATLEGCLASLQALDYPNYEVIVVDDGSTDDTRSIVERFPSIRVVHQANQGLSVARNVGLQQATGTIIAYTDSDCMADPGWLTHLVYQLQQTGAAGAGGPNLTPEDGRLAACVAAAPGQPTHVLESDQVAEHVPGCNMAFLRDALLALKGFDPVYRKAGDDVDLCWRLQQAGYWITFAPGAFVWHHRRQTARAYLRQQAGYGEAEALLRFKHPDKFTGRGDGKWHGVFYGSSLGGLRLAGAMIYQGTFGTALFQCLYQPGAAHWAMLPATLEWHLLAGIVGLTALFWAPAWMAAAAMFALSLGVSFLRAAQANVSPDHDGLRSRLLVAALCYLQPLVRSWARYKTRFFAYRPPTEDSRFPPGRHGLPLLGCHTEAYWSENGPGRMQLLGCVILYLNEHRWGRALDSGWSSWDLEIYCHPWTVVRVLTTQEEHGGKKHLIRVRYWLRPSGSWIALALSALLCGVVGAGLRLASVSAFAPCLLACCLFIWWRGAQKASMVLALFDGWARDLDLTRIATEPGRRMRRRFSWSARPWLSGRLTPASRPAAAPPAALTPPCRWQSREAHP